MWSAPSTLSKVRSARALSRKRLAKLAGVSASTVSRIEKGDIDPTLTMLTRLLGAAGFELELRAKPVQQRSLAGVAAAWQAADEAEPVDWIRLRGLIDALSLHPEDVERAIATPPARRDPVTDTLLAGLAEKLADDNDLPRPPWTHEVPPLVEVWAPLGTPMMLERFRESTPSQLALRGLTVPVEDLWRGTTSG